MGLYNFPGGRVKITHYTLQMMAEIAYDLREFQISGGPAWADASHENIRIPLNSEQRAMLQGLLAERFHLKVHRETKKDASVYFLPRSDQPTKLMPAKDTSQLPWVGGPLGGKILGDGIARINASAAFLDHPACVHVHGVAISAAPGTRRAMLSDLPKDNNLQQ